MGPRFSRGRRLVSAALLLRRGGALDESLAALHLVSQRRFVDLDNNGVGVDAEILHQRLRDVAHHAGLLFIGAAGGHADGDFRHCCLSLFSCSLARPSLPDLIRQSIIWKMHTRVKPAYDKINSPT